MIKKPTLIVLICAIIVVGGVYYYGKHGAGQSSSSTGTEKPAFKLSSADVTSITIEHPAKAAEAAIHLEKKNGSWQITQPLATDADQTTVGAIADDLADAQVSQTEPGTPDRLKVYGLTTPQVRLNFQTKNGAKHTVELGNKDFTGSSVYARIDGAATVDVLSDALFTGADKSLNDLRDKTVLHLTADDVQSFDLRNASGEIAASRAKSGWTLIKPRSEPGDEEGINGLLTTLSGAKMADIASETANDLAKYGLAHPAITFSAKDKSGKTSTLLVGKKQGDNWYARDASRPMVFTIDAALEDKLGAKYDALRDKKLSEIEQQDVKHIQLHDPSGEFDISRSGDKWTFTAPTDEKGKQAETWKVFSAIMDARAVDVMDHPSADIQTKLAKPEISLTLTQNDGKKWTLQVSAPAGDFVYARASDRQPVYKLSKDLIQSLNLKPSDLVF